MSLEEISKSFDNYSQLVDEIVKAQLKKTSEKILVDSRKLAPVDTGLMVKESESVKLENDIVLSRGTEFEYATRYNIDYSLYVHEDLSKNHPNGGQAKFLEKATIDNSEKHFRDLAKQIRKIS